MVVAVAREVYDEIGHGNYGIVVVVLTAVIKVKNLAAKK